MRLLKKESLYLFEFPALSRISGVIHAVTSRLGGTSLPPFDALNLSLDVGDDSRLVMMNRFQVRKAAGGGIQVYGRQAHGTDIAVISDIETDTRSTPEAPDIRTIIGTADALITNVPGIRLVIQTADCQAVLVVDPEKQVVANIHSGWRGSAANIIQHALSRMTAEFGCNPRDMVAAIGPSLGPCCAEFIHYQTELPQALWPFRTGAHHFDFWRISRHQLMKAGVSGDHIHIADICTRCNPHLFFSYRKARETGRFAALIGLDAD
ncbi:peptidoglycan editing factor PgeF [Desulfosarcina sp. OttesenSCG-928-G17]|nr:peptidoglycan editing factor PgeF [Desulfosarcina sp. OttesenSCG-928-G17]